MRRGLGHANMLTMSEFHCCQKKDFEPFNTFYYFKYVCIFVLVSSLKMIEFDGFYAIVQIALLITLD